MRHHVAHLAVVGGLLRKQVVHYAHFVHISVPRKGQVLGLTHFQARRWKEARVYLTKVLQRDPENISAREMMNTINKMDPP